jgi:hypothetical protein
MPVASTERGGAVRPPHPAAGDDHRALGPREQRDGFFDRGGIAERPRRRLPGRRVVDALLFHFFTEDVAGHVDVHRARTPGGRLPEGGGDDVGDALGVEDPLRPLGDRLHD